MYFSSRHGRRPKSSDDWPDRYLDSEIERVMYGSSQEEIVAKLEELYQQWKTCADLQDELEKQVEALSLESDRLGKQAGPFMTQAEQIVGGLPPDIQIPDRLRPREWE